MHRAHKIRLRPTEEQEQMLRKACGTERYTWNWALAEWNRQYSEGGKPNALSLKKQWNSCKPEWVKESPKDANQQPFANLGKAFNAFFKGTAERPRFKKRGVHDSFYVSNDKFRLEGRRVRLPIIGWVPMREELRLAGRILSATVSRSAGKWFISISVELPESAPPEAVTVVGVDAGVGRIGVASDGSECLNPKALKSMQGRLRRAQRSLARKQKGSANRNKALVHFQRLHEKACNVRDDAIHKFTSRLAKNHGKAVIETLKIDEMKEKAPRWLRVLLQDTAMQEMHRQLLYKMPTEKAPQFFASSKTCSVCGAKKAALTLSERTYRCDICGHAMDRDLNAAMNLAAMRWATPCRPVEGPKDPGKQEACEAHLCVSEA